MTLLGLISLAGCSGEDNPVHPEPGSLDLNGVYVEAHQQGILYGEYMRVTVAARSLAPVPARSRASIDARAELTHWVHTGIQTYLGSYDGGSGTLHLGDQGRTFTGWYEADGSSILGTARTLISPAIFACAVEGRGAVNLYSGTFESENQLPTRLWAVVIAGARLQGIRSGTLGDSDAFSGAVSGAGSSREIVLHGDLGDGLILSGNGTLDTETGQITGSYKLDQDGATLDSGVWSGAKTDVQDVMASD
jgi:hypothetical protein